MLKVSFSPLFTVTALLATLLFSQSALAHAHLKNQYPAANARVDASPQALTLTFSEDIEPAFSSATLTNEKQQTMPTGKVGRTAAKHNEMIVPLEKPLPKGEYQVQWRVLSVDGHNTEGKYGFSVK